MPIGGLMREAGPEIGSYNAERQRAGNRPRRRKRAVMDCTPFYFEPDDLKAPVTPVRWLQAMRASGP